MMPIRANYGEAPVLAAALPFSPPAFAQVDFSGSWAPLHLGICRNAFPALNLGLPLNDATRLRADTYDANRTL
jgi:hypothetical protein